MTLADLCSWAGRVGSNMFSNPRKQVFSWRVTIITRNQTTHNDLPAKISKIPATMCINPLYFLHVRATTPSTKATKTATIANNSMDLIAFQKAGTSMTVNANTSVMDKYYKNLSWMRGADIKIRPRVTVWHHEALPSDAKQWSRGTDFYIRTKQLW